MRRVYAVHLIHPAGPLTEVKLTEGVFGVVVPLQAVLLNLLRKVLRHGRAVRDAVPDDIRQIESRVRGPAVVILEAVLVEQARERIHGVHALIDRHLRGRDEIPEPHSRGLHAHRRRADGVADLHRVAVDLVRALVGVPLPVHGRYRHDVRHVRLKVQLVRRIGGRGADRLAVELHRHAGAVRTGGIDRLAEIRRRRYAQREAAAVRCCHVVQIGDDRRAVRFQRRCIVDDDKALLIVKIVFRVARHQRDGVVARLKRHEVLAGVVRDGDAVEHDAAARSIAQAQIAAQPRDERKVRALHGHVGEIVLKDHALVVVHRVRFGDGARRAVAHGVLRRDGDRVRAVIKHHRAGKLRHAQTVDLHRCGDGRERVLLQRLIILLDREGIPAHRRGRAVDDGGIEIHEIRRHGMLAVAARLVRFPAGRRARRERTARPVRRGRREGKLRHILRRLRRRVRRFRRRAWRLPQQLRAYRERGIAVQQQERAVRTVRILFARRRRLRPRGNVYKAEQSRQHYERCEEVNGSSSIFVSHTVRLSFLRLECPRRRPTAAKAAGRCADLLLSRTLTLLRPRPLHVFCRAPARARHRRRAPAGSPTRASRGRSRNRYPPYPRRASRPSRSCRRSCRRHP